MLLIECPWCGPRAETEFSYGGEAGIMRPPDPDALSDAEWADYLFYRANPCGAHRELWNHAHGCRRWFGVERDTLTYQIARSYSLDAAPETDAANPVGARHASPASEIDSARQSRVDNSDEDD